MATLTTAVNASATSWVVDALPTTHFIQVDDEIVEIEATFATIYDRRTGTTVPNKLRVLRAALGTTAASHSGGATLVPVYGAGAGGGGSLTLDNTVDPPAEVTTIIASGATFDGAEATLRGKDFYAQDADPGEVGAGSVWKDTGSTPQAWWLRNVANDGWEAVVQIAVEGVLNESVAATAIATASGTGVADVAKQAVAVDGSALAKSIAITSGSGEASARNEATSDGAGDASTANTASANGSGNSQAFAEAWASDPGGAAESYMLASRGAGEASIRCKVTAAGLVQILATGLPTSNPNVAGQLWNDTGVVKVSAG